MGSSPRVRGKRVGVGDAGAAVGLIPARAGKTAGGGSRGSSHPAHPRACGENFVAFGADVWSKGSSPRVRGKQDMGRDVPVGNRLIPARAGKTSRSATRCPPGWAHPRACGENCGRGITRVFPPGSSPRVRGKLPALRAPVRRGRLIPARAGKTGGHGVPARVSKAHPRACGENRAWTGARERHRGSSPRVRGKPPQNQREPATFRLIPARAGKTTRRPRTEHSQWAHPRACGENKVPRLQHLRMHGSSPRVRGKPRRPRIPRPGAGLIPARAGKTGTRWTALPRPWAHPRACGENDPTAAPTLWATGSSPRVRGKRRRQVRAEADEGLIPARAGKTFQPAPRPLRGAAHPRACGENSPGCCQAARALGSSPRVRGKPRAEDREMPRPGLIPARAGKTTTPAPKPAPSAAHPRACGENGGDDGVDGAGGGSSPRVRGKHW